MCVSDLASDQAPFGGFVRAYPTGPIAFEKFASLLKETAKMSSEAVQKEYDSREKEIFEYGFRQGLKAALFVFNF
jgi:hypothetical protein